MLFYGGESFKLPFFSQPNYCVPSVASDQRSSAEIRQNMIFFFKMFLLLQIKVVFLHHQNPPSLSTMLKCAGRFIFVL